MCDLVVRVVMDVLREVGVELLKLLGVDGIPTSARYFAVLDSPQFVVLYPEITFQDLGCCRKSKHGRIAFG